MLLSSQRFTIGSGPSALFGPGARAELPAIVAGWSRERAFLVTDRGLTATGLSDEVQQILRRAGIQTAAFDGVQANPDTETLARGAQAVRAAGADVVIALGGGSVLDAAKGIALMATNEGAPLDFDYRNEPAHPGLPIVAIPTTAGTGSETNGFGVIDDHAARRKFYVGHVSVLPRAVILDPDSTRGLPPRPTATSGLDALSHALEALSSKRNNPYAAGLSLQVVSTVRRFLPLAVADGQNGEARAQMLLAAHLAGLAFATTGLGLAHAVAHGLSARLATVHGAALAVMLPHVLAFNLPVCSATYARAAWALGVSGSAADDRDAALAAVEAVRRLAHDLGMPGTLRELGCTEAMLPTLVEDALADEVLDNTPRLPTADELRALLEAAY